VRQPTTRIRAITIQQPWLWAILELGKRLENRTWKPSAAALAPGEWLALHASKTYDTQGALVLRAAWDVCVPSKSALPRGAVVAVARYLGTVDARARRAAVDPWFVGPYALELGDVIALPCPVACSGVLGLWDLTAEVLAEVREGAKIARARTRETHARERGAEAMGAERVPAPSLVAPSTSTALRPGVGGAA